MAFRIPPNLNRAQRSAARRKARLERALSVFPGQPKAPAIVDSTRERKRVLSEFPGHDSEPGRDLSDAVGAVTPSHKGLDE